MHGHLPLVSVCIPSFNCERYIGETIHCLLNQTYKNLEIIVVDDGSTDGTVSILKGVQDKRFNYVIQANKSAAAARNAAFRLSAGKFIKFMDADDLVSSECIEIQLNRIVDHPGCVGSAKWYRFYNNDIQYIKKAPESVWRDMAGINWLVESLVPTGGNMMQPGIFLIPRNIVEEAGPWNETLSLIDDYEYMVRILCESEQVLYCTEAILYYRSGNINHLSGKKTGRDMKSAMNALTLASEHILSVRNDAESRLACANSFQRWALQFYPNHLELCMIAESKVQELGGSSIGLFGGKVYKLLASLIGWKFAKRVKIILGRNTD